MQKVLRHTLLELLYHSPFTALGTLVGVGLAAALVITYTGGSLKVFADEFFHVTHPLHMFLSAIVTAAVFYKHKRSFIATLPVGIVGAIAPCTLSDILIPYLSGHLLLGVRELELHICLLNHPHLVLTSAVLGTLTGTFLTRVTSHASLIPHSGHIFVSSAASTLYFIAFGASPTAQYLLSLIPFVFLAVLLPCCTSDIIFPMLFLPSEVHGYEVKLLANHRLLHPRRHKEEFKKL